MIKHVLLNRFLTPLVRFKSFRTDRKIVVFESDDWGAMTTPSKDVYNKMIAAGVNLEKSHYTRLDTLEDVSDVEALFEVLLKYKDCNGHHPVITMNYIMANPDYEAIRKSNFSDYYYETVERTYNRWNRGDVLGNVITGVSEGCACPQLHGREHLNVCLWLHYLQKNFSPLRKAFDYEMFAVTASTAGPHMESVKRSLYSKSQKELDVNIQQIEDAQLLFDKTFGRKSCSFVAPNYCWNPDLENTMKECGIKYLQSSYIQTYYDIVSGKKREKWHYIGQKNKNGLLFSVRNVKFEPAEKDVSIVDKTLKSIQTCFDNHYPAVISCHRVNFNSGLVKENRDRTLIQLNQLLSQLTEIYPSIEFMSSESLFKIMEN